MSNTIIEIKNLTKRYQRGSEEIHALDTINLTIERGDFISITGASGSGKTTLMNIIGCIDNPTKGAINIENTNVSKMPQKELTKIRRDTLGFVFQQFYLIPTLTASENVQLPGLFADNVQREQRAKELLELVGLGERVDHLPSQMSGGEMQRVAIARALINSPKILLADEPTGNLDSKNAEIIFDTFRKLNKNGLTIVVVTHSTELAQTAQKMIFMKDGKVDDKTHES
ncbi:MAG: Cell division transporter, ATP-binding protein FtsE [uncultured Sulfurovum sp.]|uniref:Cell division transporter, ATP-binding protein FtsE n=1 Tax=uncultured Sulfurovum sp. TaxID=269237 RepID=A0A6S6T6R3_9BACT|nr:MAG: Cell division transporter, ATP-binding protein FtsE [uncultured Sulfurovum sp.]